MTEIQRRALETSWAGAGFEADAVSAEPMTVAERSTIAGADRDGDGRLAEAELDALFARLDHADGRDDGVATLERGGERTSAGRLYDLMLLASVGSGRAQVPLRTEGAPGRLEEAVDTALAAHRDAHVGPMPDDAPSLQRAAHAAAGERDLEASAATLRTLYRIPAERTTAGGRTVDGWSATTDQGRSRRIGLDAEGQLLTRRVLERLGGSERTARAAELAFDRAEQLYGRCDRALVLAIAARETRGGALDVSPGTVNVFHQGGIDNLPALLRDRTLFAASELRGWQAHDADAGNERGRTVSTADVPRAAQLRAYAGAIESAWRRFEAEVCSRFGQERGRQMLDRMSDGARRAWIQISFGGARGAEYGSRREYGGDLGLRTVLGRLAERAQGETPDLDAVLEPDDFLDPFQRVRRARVTAAEAELLETALSTPSTSSTRAEEP
jgi:hypothetical protein